MAVLVPLVVELVVSAIITAAVSFASQALTASSSRARKRVSQGVQPVEVAPDALGVAAQPGGPAIGIFGHRRVGGRVVLDRKEGTKTYICIVIASRPVTSINSVWLNNELTPIDTSGAVVTGKYAGTLNFKFYTGAQVSADATLLADIPGWTAQHVGRKVAYVRVVVDPGTNTVFNSGLPDMTFDVQGHAVYDPRDAAQTEADPASWQYSDNAALIEAGYLVHELGRKLPTSRVDWGAYAVAATVCDQAVPLAGGGAEARYRCAVKWLTDERHETVLTRIGAAHGSQGPALDGRRYGPATRNPFAPSVDASYAPDDYEEGGLTLADTPPIGEIANGVRGIFSSPDFAYEIRDFPQYQDVTALAEDGEPYWLDLDLSYVTSHQQAQRLARAAYSQARYGYDASVELNFGAFDTVAGDLITLTDDLAGLTAAPFRVVRDGTSADFKVTLALEHETDAFFAWGAADEQPFEPVVSLAGAAGSAAGGAAGGATTEFKATTELKAAGGDIIDINASSGAVHLSVKVHPSPTAGVVGYTVGVLGLAPSLSIDLGDLSGGDTADLGTFSAGVNLIILYVDFGPLGFYSFTIDRLILAPGVGGTRPLLAYDGSTASDNITQGLSAPGRPSLQSTLAGQATINVPGVPDGTAERIELLTSSTLDINTAAVAATLPISTVSQQTTIGGTTGATLYLWARSARDATPGKRYTALDGPVSQVTAIVFG